MKYPTTCLLATGVLLSGSILAAAERNIIFFVTDDEGQTLGCYGDPVAVTTNIDALAKDGTLFRYAYATTASCSASRSVIMSGLHNHMNGQYGHQHHYHKFASFHDVVSLAPDAPPSELIDWAEAMRSSYPPPPVDDDAGQTPQAIATCQLNDTHHCMVPIGPARDAPAPPAVLVLAFEATGGVLPEPPTLAALARSLRGVLAQA